MVFRCESCGSSKFVLVNDYLCCEYCGSSHVFDLDEPNKDFSLHRDEITISELRRAFHTSCDYATPIRRGGVRL